MIKQHKNYTLQRNQHFNDIHKRMISYILLTDMTLDALQNIEADGRDKKDKVSNLHRQARIRVTRTSHCVFNRYHLV